MEDYKEPKYFTSDRLMEAVRKLGYEQRYKVCEEFYQMFIEGLLGDDSEAILEFHDIFEETDPSLGPGEIRKVKRCVNAMEIALDEIDEYEPEVFFRIVKVIEPLLEKKKV